MWQGQGYRGVTRREGAKEGSRLSALHGTWLWDTALVRWGVCVGWKRLLHLWREGWVDLVGCKKCGVDLIVGLVGLGLSDCGFHSNDSQTPGYQVYPQVCHAS